MNKENEWLIQEMSEITKETRIKSSENKIMLKFILFLVPFTLLAYAVQSHECPHCNLPISVTMEKEVNWRCEMCRYYNSDTSGGDWAGDYYCGKCGHKK